MISVRHHQVAPVIGLAGAWCIDLGRWRNAVRVGIPTLRDAGWVANYLSEKTRTTKLFCFVWLEGRSVTASWGKAIGVYKGRDHFQAHPGRCQLDL